MRPRLFFWVIISTIAGSILSCTQQTAVVFTYRMLAIGDRVINDDFNESNKLGWDTYQGVEGNTVFEEKEYKINVKTPFAEIWANPDPKYTIPNDVIIEVQARSAASEDNYFGMICRYQDNNNFYFLVVTSDGYYGIGKIKAGQHSLVNRSEMPPSELLIGASILFLRAECTGNRLALFANGSILDEQIDTDFSGGGVGLIAGSYENEVTIFFDNFTVYQYKP